MSNDFDARLSDLLRRTTQFSERLTSSLANARSASASSEGGSVTVSINSDSTLDRVEVFDGWRREVEPEGLGSLILSTMGLAFGEQFGRWAELAPDAMEQSVDATPPRPATVGATPPRGAAGDRFAAQALRSEGGLDGAMDELVDSLKAATAHSVEAYSRDGHATATADGQGSVVGLTFDVDWLETASSGAVAAAATEAIRSAHTRGVASTDIAAITASSRLGRIHDNLIERHPDTRKDR